MKLSRTSVRSEHKGSEFDAELRLTPVGDLQSYANKDIPLINEEQAKAVSYSLIKYVNGISYIFIVPHARSKVLKQTLKLNMKMTRRFERPKSRTTRQE